MPVKTNTQTLTITAEDSFGVLNSPTSFNVPILQMELDVKSLKRQTLENTAVAQDQWKHINAAGLQFPEAKLPFKTYAEGLGTAAGDGDTPAVTGISMLLGACSGMAPVVVDGGTVKAASTPTTTSIEETTSGTNSADTLVAFGFADGHAEVRPVKEYAAGVMTLGMPLSAAPVAGDIIYGGLHLESTELGDAYSLQAEIAGNNKSQSYRLLGMVGTFTVEQATEQEAQTLSWEFSMSQFERNVTATKQSPGNYVPLPLAGSELKISKAGSDAAPVSLCVGRVTVSLGAEYTAKYCTDDNRVGMGGYILSARNAEIKVTVYDDASVHSGHSNDNYYDIFGSNDGDENAFQLLFSFGRQEPGRIFALYAKKAHLSGDPDPSDVDGLGTQELTFNITSGTEHALQFLFA